MKKVMIALVVALLIAPFALAQTGNGGPSGAHYNLNIIGVPNPKENVDMTGTNGHSLFVPLVGKATILLCDSSNPSSPCFGQGFSVLDRNGTDGPASFALPNPDPDGDGTTVYSVFARALGSPKDNPFAKMMLCAVDSLGVELCSTANALTLTRKKGKSTFENVTKNLLYLYTCSATDPVTGACTTWTRVPLFDDDFVS